MESPSFNQHSSNNIADIADRVVQELHTHNSFNNDDDVFAFIDKNSNTNAEFSIKNNENEQDFEFPIISPGSTSSETLIYEDQISPKFPLFDQTLLQDLDLNSSTKANKCSGVNPSSSLAPTLEHVPALLRPSRAPEPVLVPISPKPALEPIEASLRKSPVLVLAPERHVLAPEQAPVRLSLMKLFDQDRNSASTSSSDADDLDVISPETYCVWNPSQEAQLKPPLRGKHKKSNSISIGNTSKRWHVRDLLKRSYSDDNYTVNSSPVVLFLPPVSPKPKTNNEKVKTKGDKHVKGGEKKAENKVPAYKGKIGNIRLPAYLPYRQDQIAVFNGSSKNMYRY